MVKEISVSQTVEASPATVWAMVTDLTRMGEWSPEATGGTWVGDATGPAVGAKFNGNNKNGKKSWSTVSTVTTFEPERRFAFDAKAAGMKIARWTYEIEPTPTGCVVTETWTDQRNAILPLLGKIASGVSDRTEHNRAGMVTTLANLAAAAVTAPR
jgi:uncharacterized protein YndB with AHSA1/START domain